MASTSPDFAGMDPTQAGQELGKWAEGLQRKAQAFQALQQRMAQLSVTETSADGAVRVVVDAQGVPTELTVTRQARDVEPERISAELMACLRRAQRRLADQVRDLVEESVPGGDESAQRVVASYRDRFPDEPPGPTLAENMPIGRLQDQDSPPPPPPPPARKPVAQDDEDGWNDRPFLR